MNQLAVSLAGHDKNRVYAVVSENDETVILADGRIRTLEKPKKKNPRHIRRIAHLPEEIVKALEDVSRDSDLVHVLRLYQTYRKEESLQD